MVFSLLQINPVYAQSISKSAQEQESLSSQAYVAEAADVLNVFARWMNSFNSCKAELDENLYHSTVSFWPAAAKVPIYGIKDTISLLNKICVDNPLINASLVTRYVDLFDDTAVIFGTLNLRLLLDGKSTVTPLRFSMTFARENSRWKILHIQSALIPFPTEID